MHVYRMGVIRMERFECIDTTTTFLSHMKREKWI